MVLEPIMTTVPAVTLDTLSTIAVSEDGDLIITHSQGGASFIGRLEKGGTIDLVYSLPEEITEDTVADALVEHALDHADWTEIHKAYALCDWGTDIYLMPDGSHFTLEHSTRPGPDCHYVGIIRAQGNNLDRSVYSEDWAESMDDEEHYGQYQTEDGRILSCAAMMAESIENGDWSDLYEQWRNELREQIRERQAQRSY
jgi:hypothetical protein